LEFQNKPVPFFIEWADVVEDGALLKLRGIHTPEEVQALRGKRVWATSEALTGYRAQKTSDIIGYLVVNYDDGKEIGPVRQMHSASGNELIEVDMGHKTVLLPYHASLIRAVDPKGPKLVMDIAHGLLDL
jgi:ribosomal 30S subunit maturation factor RimM